MDVKLTHIPVFPLQVVVLPGEVLPLFIFEPRYKQLIAEQAENGTGFGIPFIHNKQIQEFGSFVKLHRILNALPGGEMEIEIKGLKPFKMSDYYEHFKEKLYAGADAYFYDPTDHIPADNRIKSQVVNYIVNYQKSDAIDAALMRSQLMEMKDSYQLAAYAQLPHVRKYQLLGLAQENERLIWLLNELKLMTEIKNKEDALGNNFMLN